MSGVEGMRRPKAVAEERHTADEVVQIRSRLVGEEMRGGGVSEGMRGG